MEKDLNIKDIPHIPSEKCYFCGIELTKLNTSPWVGFAVIEGKETTIDQCGICHEICNRLISSSERVGDTLIPQKTEKEIRKELEDEGLTAEILIAKDELELDITEGKGIH